MDSLNQQPYTSPKRSGLLKAFIALIIIILLLLVIVVTYALKFGKNQTAIKNEVDKKAQPNLKTYINSKHGFSISYPTDKGLVIDENASFTGGQSKLLQKQNRPIQLDAILIGIPNSRQTLAITVWANPDKLSAQEWWDKNFEGLYSVFNALNKDIAVRKENVKTSFVKVGQAQAFFTDVSIIRRSPHSGPFYISHNDEIIQIDATESKLFDQILATFRLTFRLN